MIEAVSRTTIVRRAQRWVTAVIAALALVLAAQPALTVKAAEQVDQLPFVNNFATARFKLLTTVQIGDLKQYAYGGGEVVLPDRENVWVGSDTAKDLQYVVRIGSTLYQREGNQRWERSEGGSTDATPVSAQFNELQQIADSIQIYGDENVGTVATTRYQVWLSGSKLVELGGAELAGLDDELTDLLSQTSVKYDFWIGKQDGFLHQQNTVVYIPATTISGVDLPESQTSTLIMYYDINNPRLVVNAPQ
ncbi:MAG TPA: hypothetical protein VFS21_29350 [Roseiflexaceae bacterium]|nr:hypothetical protein [Roseiflexaceae bacterium]